MPLGDCLFGLGRVKYSKIKSTSNIGGHTTLGPSGRILLGKFTS